jgi:hypothetical protein
MLRQAYLFTTHFFPLFGLGWAGSDPEVREALESSVYTYELACQYMTPSVLRVSKVFAAPMDGLGWETAVTLRLH